MIKGVHVLTAILNYIIPVSVNNCTDIYLQHNCVCECQWACFPAFFI